MKCATVHVYEKTSVNDFESARIIFSNLVEKKFASANEAFSHLQEHGYQLDSRSRLNEHETFYLFFMK
jgi:hypothetical protein